MAPSKSRSKGKKPQLILLSPAKSLDFETPAPTGKAGVPRFLKQQTGELAGVLKEKSAVELAGLMSLSGRLAELNFQRNQSFDAAVIEKQARRKAAPRPPRLRPSRPCGPSPGTCTRGSTPGP